MPAVVGHTRPLVARRTHQPPRRRVGRLAGALPVGVSRHRRGDHPRPVLPGQRGAVDPRVGPRQGSAVRGNYPGWLERKSDRLEREEKQNDARRRTLERELEWVRMAPKARQAKSKARLAAYEQLQADAEAAGRSADKLQIAIPAGPRLGDQVIEADGLSKGYGDRLLIDDLTFSLPRAGIVGVIGPNGAGQDHVVPDDRRGCRRRRRVRRTTRRGILGRGLHRRPGACGPVEGVTR
ncbi:MAG: hypothetical protein M5U19_12525 [Microthrixaceae bacterium]|nr:hypothetical protein [Microthrixaceae bacterium]